jgi:hypothetical protein
VFFTGPGDVIRVAPDGTRTVVVSGLNRPTSLIVDWDGTIYVTNNGISAGSGEVLQNPAVTLDSGEMDRTCPTCVWVSVVEGCRDHERMEPKKPVHPSLRRRAVADRRTHQSILR